jgi:hypothetical protein
VHGKHPVENLRGDEIVMRTNQLNPHDRRFDSADHKKNQGIDDIQNAQPLVINRRNPFVELIDEWTRKLSLLGQAWNQSTSATLLVRFGNGLKNVFNEVSPDKRLMRPLLHRSTASRASGTWLDRVGIFNPESKIFRLY